LGCVLYEMAMLKPPFRADNPSNLFKKIMVGEYEKIGQPYSKELSNFISKLMTHSQKLRPDVKEMLCYPKIMDLKEEIDEE
jgi:NIMA (never in mitosis gene a)-related kinase 1/4/5